MKDIKEEIREIVRGVGNQALIEKEMVIGSDIIEDKVSRLVKLFNKQLDNNTKSVKKESVETIKRTKYTKKDLKELAVTNMSTRIMKAHNKAIDEAIKAIK